MPKRKRKTIRRIQPWERLPMHFAEEVGGAKEVALIEEPDGEFRIQTREHEYPLDEEQPDVKIEAEKVFIINKAIDPSDIKRISSLDDAGIRGGIHSAHTYLVALHDGSLWIYKQTGTEERDEIFVYRLALAMFRGIVPTTEPLYVPKLGWGSAQRKVAGVPAGRVDGLHGYFHGNEEMQADLVAMLVLDYLTGNPDRHANNWFIMHNDRLAAIDNGWAGEDPTMTLSAVFEPARLAGLIRDESLWAGMLKVMLALINEISGRGDEARALAEEIAIDRKEAVDMLRLWEPKLQRLARFIQVEASKLTKEKVYIEPGTQPPLGVHVEEGPRGGTYYESEDIPTGMEEVEQEPTEFAPQPLTAEAVSEAEMFNDGIFGAWLEDYKVSNDVGEFKLREMMKDDISSMIAERTGISYGVVNNFIKAWAGSAAGSAESLAMQNAAAELFGLEENDYIKEQGQWRFTGGEQYEIRAGRSKQIVQAMYDETQEWLKAQGVDHLVLFRGMRWTEEDAPAGIFAAQAGAGKDIEFHANPLSSWSSDPNIAEEFANYHAEGAEEGEPDYEDEDYQDCLDEDIASQQGIAVEEARQQAYENEIEFDEEAFDENFDAAYDSSDSDCYAPTKIPVQVKAFAVAQVPAEKIIALSVTGLGCLNEREVIVAGGPQSIRMYSEYVDENEPIGWENFIEEGAEAPSEPKTAQEQQEAQKKEWVRGNLTPLFERLTQHQKVLRESYDVKYTEAMNQGASQAELQKLRDNHWELYHEMQADMLVEGKKLIEAAGYIPEGAWEAAEAAPMSPELAAWRKEHYKEWVEENLADDASAWIDKKNEIEDRYREQEEQLPTPAMAGEDLYVQIDRLQDQRLTEIEALDQEYFRQGAEKIREAGFEPEGTFAEQEALDVKAGK